MKQTAVLIPPSYSNPRANDSNTIVAIALIPAICFDRSFAESLNNSFHPFYFFLVIFACFNIENWQFYQEMQPASLESLGYHFDLEGILRSKETGTFDSP